jgi:hypothetical protein
MTAPHVIANGRKLAAPLPCSIEQFIVFVKYCGAICYNYFEKYMIKSIDIVESGCIMASFK